MRDGWRRVLSVAAPEHRAFRRALGDPEAAQAGVLAEILRANRGSAFGRRHGFAGLDREGAGPDAFRRRVPVQAWDDVAGEVDAMAGGARARLCAGRVRLYEETTGTAGRAKLVPYTAASLRAFRRALYPWLADLVRARPRIGAGRAYWALSPAARPARAAPDGTPIGMATDAGYFGPALGAAFAGLSVVPPALGGITDMEAWRYLTLRALVAAEDLALVSVWSPTFLAPLLAALEAWGPALVEDVARGTVGGPAAGLARAAFPPDPARARRLAAALARRPVDTAALWPALDTISCWTDAGARPYVAAVRAAFPHAAVQGKGLLATETAVSIPLAEAPHPVLALHSAFFEFVDADGRARGAGAVADGETYRVLVTTHGGLYRYDLGDRVRVRGRLERTPLLEFVGRDGLVSDLCGEKLSEALVLRHLPAGAGFAMLAPARAARPHYVLFLDAARADDARARGLADGLDAALRENPHWAHARDLEQLGPIRACRVADPIERYMRAAAARGQRLAVVKPPALRPEADWEATLA